jgi:hypothetical protein
MRPKPANPIFSHLLLAVTGHGPAVKKIVKEEEHLTPSCEGANKTKLLALANLCALASLREIVYFFTPWDARATFQRPGGTTMNRGRPPLPRLIARPSWP